jgi:hypothetical protein
MAKQLRIYYFIYSHLGNYFDSKITEVDNLSILQLRCRLNTHRNLELYAIPLTEEEAGILDESIYNSDLFEKLEKYITKVGF